MVFTRPDIIFAIRKLSQYFKEPVEYYRTGLRGLLRYIR
jgi:hypothetical protein